MKGVQYFQFTDCERIGNKSLHFSTNGPMIICHPHRPRETLIINASYVTQVSMTKKYRERLGPVTEIVISLTTGEKFDLLVRKDADVLSALFVGVMGKPVEIRHDPNTEEPKIVGEKLEEMSKMPKKVTIDSKEKPEIICIDEVTHINEMVQQLQLLERIWKPEDTESDMPKAIRIGHPQVERYVIRVNADHVPEPIDETKTVFGNLLEQHNKMHADSLKTINGDSPSVKTPFFVAPSKRRVERCVIHVSVDHAPKSKDEESLEDDEVPPLENDSESESDTDEDMPDLVQAYPVFTQKDTGKTFAQLKVPENLAEPTEYDALLSQLLSTVPKTDYKKVAQNLGKELNEAQELIRELAMLLDRVNRGLLFPGDILKKGINGAKMYLALNTVD